MNKLFCGANTPMLAQVSGYAVECIRNNPAYAEALGLDANMTAETSTNRGVSWGSVNDSHILTENEWLRFNRQAGKKG